MTTDNKPVVGAYIDSSGEVTVGPNTRVRSRRRKNRLIVTVQQDIPQDAGGTVIGAVIGGSRRRRQD